MYISAVTSLSLFWIIDHVYRLYGSFCKVHNINPIYLFFCWYIALSWLVHNIYAVASQRSCLVLILPRVEYVCLCVCVYIVRWYIPLILFSLFREKRIIKQAYNWIGSMCAKEVVWYYYWWVGILKVVKRIRTFFLRANSVYIIFFQSDCTLDVPSLHILHWNIEHFLI